MALLNKSLFSKYSPLPKNYNFEEIMLYQPVAIEIWVRPILGDAFTDALEYEVEHNQVSEENSTLMVNGGLLQYLSYAMCLESLPFIWTHMSEVGITLGKSDNSDSISLKDLTYIEQHLRRQVEFLKDAFIKWICSHQDSFPIFNPKGICPCCDSCCDGTGKLNTPNPFFEMYGFKKHYTDLL